MSNELNNSDTDFLAWDMSRPTIAPKPGDWAFGLTAAPLPGNDEIPF